MAEYRTIKMIQETRRMAEEAAHTIEELERRVQMLEGEWRERSMADGLGERVKALEAEWKRRRGGRPRKQRNGET
jgi:hypothetical protein